ncbi:hypothetical protein BR93DRAFT_922760 [Coniochaeta sp. PMI_546]|nr:hypothetical protein BR93DRAFT_922760 [Coniochaeta sp. PMI_546]
MCDWLFFKHLVKADDQVVESVEAQVGSRRRFMIGGMLDALTTAIRDRGQVLRSWMRRKERFGYQILNCFWC